MGIKGEFGHLWMATGMENNLVRMGRIGIRKTYPGTCLYSELGTCLLTAAVQRRR